MSLKRSSLLFISLFLVFLPWFLSSSATHGPSAAVPESLEQAPFMAGAECSNSFTDVPTGYWAEDYIVALSCGGISGGYPDGTYKPTTVVNRAQMAVYVVRAVEGDPASDYCGGVAPFTDVASTHWACGHIKRLSELGISTGYPDGSYKPTLSVNRAQMAVYVVRAVEGDPAPDYCGGIEPFSDVASTHWACGHIKRLAEIGVSSGYPDGTYKPARNVNRAEMAAYVSKAFLVPVAVGDVYSIEEDTGLSNNVLSNDHDLNNDPLTCNLLSDVTSGSLSLNQDGSFTYTPDSNFYGADGFTYSASDGILESPASVSITVQPINDPPVAVAGIDQNIPKGTTAQLDGSGSYDVDGDSLTYTWTLIERPMYSTAGLSDPEIENPTLPTDRHGNYVAQLVVSDGTVDSESRTVTVFAEPVMTTMPDLINMTQANAETTITSTNLIVGAISSQYSETIPAGNVMRQEPLAGFAVPEETYVDLQISLGPAVPHDDPGTTAPPPDPTVATPIPSNVGFLYNDPDPVQKGADPAAFVPKRVSVLRGKVKDRNNDPLPGVMITIHSHPEYGHTLSRANGMFDMVINGGGQITVNYEKVGYLRVQRTVSPQWQEYQSVPDVVMIPADPTVAVVDLTGPGMKVARGSVMTDADGSRQVTMLFPEGTEAEIYMPDGYRQKIDTLTMRFTEYTLGESGPEAMPGLLPPTTEYTYALDIGVDEAVTKIDGKDVLFNKFVFAYLEDFLDITAGYVVPAGYYDSDDPRWVPTTNGRVIKILGVTGGLADIDSDGDDVADDADQLAFLEMDDAEREQLALLYSPGQILWRIPMSHFSSIDWNWAPDRPANPNLTFTTLDNICDSCECSQKTGNSVIECQAQVLTESVAIAGTPFSLNYSSKNVLGRTAERRLRFDVTGPTVSPDLLGVDLEITVAGRQFKESFPPDPSQEYVFEWDGLDAYGRQVVGGQEVDIAFLFLYPPMYGGSMSAPRRRSPALRSVIYPANEYDSDGISMFGRFSDVMESVGHGRTSLGRGRAVMQRVSAKATTWDARGQGLGGWTLSPHHVYDPVGRTLYLGNGVRRGATIQLNSVIRTVAGNGVSSVTLEGDGGPATATPVQRPGAIEVGPDGSMYIFTYWRIRRVSPEGIIQTIAALRDPYLPDNECDDGIPAVSARIGAVNEIAVGPDGSLYLAGVAQNCAGRGIKKISPDGIITTIAGGARGYGGDGGPALGAQFDRIADIDVGPDGSIYIADEGNYRVRHIGTDGIVTTIAGTGEDCGTSAGVCGEDGPALASAISAPQSVAVGPDGSVYIGFVRHIARVDTSGIIRVVAGRGTEPAEGIQAYGATIWYPTDMAVDADGTLYYISESCAFCWKMRGVRRITPDGIVRTVAGQTASGAYLGENWPPTSFKFSYISSLALDPGGNFYISDRNHNRVYQVGTGLPGYDSTDIQIASADGGLLYNFDANGLHLNTRNTLTGATVYEFNYDAENRLIEVVDGDGNTTTIERDGVGNPTAIIAPFGQRTELTLDANGYMDSITNPEIETYGFTYSAEGLLTKITDAKTWEYDYQYDSYGRLIRNDDPAGGFKTYNKVEQSDGYDITQTTAMGRATTYEVDNLDTGERRQLDTYPDGTWTLSTYRPGTEILSASDGMESVTGHRPDPRFGMQSPTRGVTRVTTPAGLELVADTNRVADLADMFNPFSLITLTDTNDINGKVSTSVYDAATRTFTSTSPEGRQATTVTDIQSRPTQGRYANLYAKNYSYDTFGRLTNVTQGVDAEARTIDIVYNPQGFVDTVTDSLSRVVEFEYDAVGRVTKQILPDLREILFAYDDNGNLTSITPPGRPVHTFNYTAIDQLNTYTPPDIGIGNTAITYQYNSDKQLTQVTRPDAQTITFNYDPAKGRLNTVVAPHGTYAYSYNVDTGLPEALTAPDSGTLTYAYDGSLVTGLTWAGTVAGSVTETFDDDFRVTSQSINAGNTVSFTYDNDSLLTGAGDLVINHYPLTGFISDTALNVIIDGWQYNDFGELEQYTATDSVAPSTLYDAVFTYDTIGRIERKVETIGGSTDTYDYSYDLAGRLEGVEKNTVATASYTYDSNGNRLTATDSFGSHTGTYDDQDRLLTNDTASYSYTTNGELLTKTDGADVTTYSYDVMGNLLSVTLPDSTGIDYVIDGQDRRVGKKVNGTLVQGFLYGDQLNPVAELDDSNNIVSRFVYGTKINVPDYMTKGGNTYRIISDHLGSVRLVVNIVDASIAQRMDYDAFGRVTQDTNPGFQPFGFAGGIYDIDTGLVRFGARDYDAETGRWTVKDPILFNGGDMNLYGYVLNDPLNSLDLDGLQTEIGKGSFQLSPADIILDRKISKYSAETAMIIQIISMIIHMLSNDDDFNVECDGTSEGIETGAVSDIYDSLTSR